MTDKKIVETFPYLFTEKRVRYLVDKKLQWEKTKRNLRKYPTEKLEEMITTSTKEIEKWDASIINHAENISKLTAQTKIERNVVDIMVNSEFKKMNLEIIKEIKFFMNKRKKGKITRYMKKR